MGEFIENYNLDCFTENDDSLFSLFCHIAVNGKEYHGYNDTTYFYNSYGDVEFMVYAKDTADNKKTITGFSVHSGNSDVWKMKYTGLDFTPEDIAPFRKTAFFSPCTGEKSWLPIDVVNADILPGISKNDEILMQIVAHPLSISYYPDEKTFIEDQPECANGEKYLVANGSLLPLQFLLNHRPSEGDAECDYNEDLLVNFTATVKQLFVGEVQFGEKSDEAFIRCCADTMFGELEFVHTIDQVPDQFIDNIKVGAIISGVCVISADVAIYEYENGIVKDFNNNLRLIRNIVTDGNADSMSAVLAEDAVYETDTYNKSYVGKQAIIDRFKYITEHKNFEYFTYFATITEAPADSVYPSGTRCIVLAPEHPSNIESLLFISVDNDGMITAIKIADKSLYEFVIDAEEDDCDDEKQDITD